MRLAGTDERQPASDERSVLRGERVLGSTPMSEDRRITPHEHVPWLGLFAVLMMISLAIAALLSRSQWVGWPHYVLLMFVTACYAGSFMIAKRQLVWRYEARTTMAWQRFALWSASFGIAVVAGTEIAARGVAFADRGNHSDVLQNRQSFFWVGFALTGAAAIIDYSYERLKKRAREFELREERLRRAALRAELSALQARTDPHFLFNTLNTLSGLIEEDPAKASEMLDRLAGVFRYALEGSRAASVPLAEELRAVEAYLQVEAIRFGSRFTWTIDAPPELSDEAVPPLFLQPLVENALVHGVAQKCGSARVDVRLTRRDRFIHVEVDDDGPGPGGSNVSGSGNALRDLRERLKLLFGTETSLQTGAGPLGGFRATLDIPVRRV